MLAKVKSDFWPWPNFSALEMACRHCGETYYWPDFMDKLQRVRSRAGSPMRILSAHRCARHNASVGGAPLSQHLKLAVDISIKGHDRAAMIAELRSAGFSGIGFYETFLHADLGRPRQWFGSSKARQLWAF